MADRKPPAGKGDDLQADYLEEAEPYWFRWAGQWWELPHPRMLDFKTQLRVENFDVSALTGDDTDSADIETAAQKAIDDLFTLVMGEEQGAEWAQITPRPLPMLLDVLDRWRKHAGTGEGESPASTGSSKSTGRPSKPTSTATTASASRKRSKAAQVAAGLPVNS